jgi:hypothetical protein
VSKHKAAPAAPPAFTLESSELIHLRALLRARREFPGARAQVDEMYRRQTWERCWRAPSRSPELQEIAEAIASVDRIEAA